MKNSSLVVAMLLATGCTTLRGRADDAYSHGKYLEAAGMYDQIVREHPDDAGARKRRTEAREAELRAELLGVQTARVAGLDTEATGKLSQLLTRRDEWGDRLSPELTHGIGFEVSAVAARIGGEVAERTASAGPLAGEHAANEYAHLLSHADFTTTRKALHTQLADAGTTRCAQLSRTATTPYTAWLVARYCEHWSIVRAVPVLPDQRTALSVEGAINGEPTSQSAELRDALASAFEHSAWFARTAPSPAHAQIGGQLAVDFSSHDVTLTASWTESVPYTVYETTQESYQEPYDDTESYSEQVPTTEYHTETTQCGDTTCTNTVPETVYHTEWKTRTVTKYRTAYRDVTNPVTHYRDEPRAQDYSAVEQDATYKDDLRVDIDRGLPKLYATVDNAASEKGYDHDVSIGVAGVSPSRANLTSQADYAAHEHARLADQMVAVLDQAYVARFCTLPAFSIEQASECAYAGASKLPHGAHTALARLFAGDEPFLSAITR